MRVSKLNIRKWCFAWSVPSHYLNQYWNIANWTLRNKPQWNVNRHHNSFIPQNAFESALCEMVSIFVGFNVLILPAFRDSLGFRYPYLSALVHWYWGDHMIVMVPVQWIWWMWVQWRPFIARFIIANILYSSILTSLHNMLPFELTKDTPYLALPGELWSVFCEYLNRNWPCYKGFLLYYVWKPVSSLNKTARCVRACIYNGMWFTYDNADN